MRRNPAVAGQFYPGTAEELRHSLGRLIPVSREPHKAFGIVSPHAGYLYSGAIAGETFARVEVPRRVVILGPNHQGLGHRAGVYAGGSWLTPLGEARIDEPLAEEILQGCPALAADETCHRFEHSLEVQVPFIQTRAPGASIVPICLRGAALDELLELGRHLGKTLARHDDVLMVASSDMTHYESGERARKKDMLALEKVLDLDPQGLYLVVREKGITMCGVVPVVVMLAAALEMGAQKATLVRYGNSGEVTGDQSEVVGYAGVIVE
ncbi:MEMO1 family protein [Desulfuromonas versatilis]|uniref:MEMO1 family protein DESUT3_19770 n=1 Tax=Desulfuromonas versatilis TaxID=2802975 RepID=A0ABM8HSM6_9BACT|nr:AmmeMemoRadiSam system protein B [Desulfuromonas versatilis]BCR04908.1 MEMO1 family protein [Desulfuromonas versatilis]